MLLNLSVALSFQLMVHEPSKASLERQHAADWIDASVGAVGLCHSGRFEPRHHELRSMNQMLFGQLFGQFCFALSNGL